VLRTAAVAALLATGLASVEALLRLPLADKIGFEPSSLRSACLFANKKRKK
jgi:hypothetical protein